MAANAEIQAHVAALSSNDSAKAAAAAEQLTQMGTVAQPAAVALVQACAAADETVRAWAVAALEEVGAPAQGQVPDLTSLVTDSNTEVAYWAITLIGRAGKEATFAVESLAKIVRKSPELALRERATWALGQIGPGAAAAVPALHEAAASGPPRLARLAQIALIAITG